MRKARRVVLILTGVVLCGWAAMIGGALVFQPPLPTHLADVVLLIVIPSVIGMGFVAVWVLKLGRARWRLRIVSEVALALWTIGLALWVAVSGTLDYPRQAADQIRVAAMQAVALWIAGFVPCALIWWWTRPSQETPETGDVT